MAEAIEDFPLNKNSRNQAVFYNPQKAFEATKETKKLQLEETIRPLARLMFYNSSECLFSDMAKKKAMERIAVISGKEARYKKIKYLPTEGIEIECYENFIDTELVDVLNSAEVGNYPEQRYDGGPNLWEVRPRFSYSPSAQSRYLEELAKLGAVPMDSEGRMDKRYIHSLHVNFGIPSEIYSAFELNQGGSDFACNKYKIREKYRNSLINYTDALTYAFSSPERVLERKTRESVLIKGDRETRKSLKTGDASLGLSANNYRWPIRLEFRTGEFRDFPTFRLLSEAQNLTAMLFAYIKGGEKKIDGHDEKEADLEILWNKFEEEYEKLLDTHSIMEKTLADYNPNSFKDYVESTSIKKDCRSLITAYSKKVTRLLGLGYESAEEQGK